MEVRTNRSARERMGDWQLEQARAWAELDRIASVLAEFASLDNYDEVTI